MTPWAVARLLCPWVSQTRILEWAPCPSPGDLPDPGIEPRSPTLQVDSLPFEPPGKPMNTGVSSLSLLQGIFLTQESNQGLLHCRQTLYQLSYQGSPGCYIYSVKSHAFIKEIKPDTVMGRWHVVELNMKEAI